MKVNVIFFATLGKNRNQEIGEVHLPKGTTVDDLLKMLMIDTTQVCTLSINKKMAAFDQVLLDGDNVTIIPPIGGG
ncbi:MAG: MoaD/ThiS family protein [Desulfotignum sp.]|nr:MoaD/ThiS family protein [Desulfotignum sp.]